VQHNASRDLGRRPHLAPEPPVVGVPVPVPAGVPVGDVGEPGAGSVAGGAVSGGSVGVAGGATMEPGVAGVGTQGAMTLAVPEGCVGCAGGVGWAVVRLPADEVPGALAVPPGAFGAAGVSGGVAAEGAVAFAVGAVEAVPDVAVVVPGVVLPAIGTQGIAVGLATCDAPGVAGVVAGAGDCASAP
jgi:hypothetical protein